MRRGPGLTGSEEVTVNLGENRGAVLVGPIGWNYRRFWIITNIRNRGLDALCSEGFFMTLVLKLVRKSLQMKNRSVIDSYLQPFFDRVLWMPN